MLEAEERTESVEQRTRIGLDWWIWGFLQFSPSFASPLFALFVGGELGRENLYAEQYWHECVFCPDEMCNDRGFLFGCLGRELTTSTIWAAIWMDCWVKNNYYLSLMTVVAKLLRASDWIVCCKMIELKWNTSFLIDRSTLLTNSAPISLLVYNKRKSKIISSARLNKT